MMLKIGNVELGNRVLAAPLAGVSDKAFRIIARGFGCALCFTEMISDMGLVYGQERTRRIADCSEEDILAVQIFGSEAEPMRKAALIVEQMGAAIIDINMGCPTPKIVRNGEGAALMRDIAKSRHIIREVVRSVKVPVTVKMRRGWDEANESYMQLGVAAEEEGAAAVTLHPRFRTQFFSGQAEWDCIKRLKQDLKIPVIGNGDIWKAEDALRMIEETGCDAVMIGRAAMGNPFIFHETVELLENGREAESPTLEERLETAKKHLELACRFKGEAVAAREMRKHLAWYIKGIRGAARLREEINRTGTLEGLLHGLEKLKEV
ncbi:MAG: tRNA dihydrouridine synthase DusB [Syntrophomonas sp.]